MKSYVVFDIETTGLNASTDKIVEIGAIHFQEGGHELDHFQSLVNPGIEIPEALTKIHGITNEMVINAPDIGQVIRGFTNFINRIPHDYYLGFRFPLLLAHNAVFDIGFINWNMRILNYSDSSFIAPLNPITCTMMYSRIKNPRLRSHSLVNLVEAYSLPYNEHHRSIADCVHTKNVWLHLDGPNADVGRLSKFQFGIF